MRNQVSPAPPCWVLLGAAAACVHACAHACFGGQYAIGSQGVDMAVDMAAALCFRLALQHESSGSGGFSTSFGGGSSYGGGGGGGSW